MRAGYVRITCYTERTGITFVKTCQQVWSKSIKIFLTYKINTRYFFKQSSLR